MSSQKSIIKLNVVKNIISFVFLKILIISTFIQNHRFELSLNYRVMLVTYLTGNWVHKEINNISPNLNCFCNILLLYLVYKTFYNVYILLYMRLVNLVLIFINIKQNNSFVFTVLVDQIYCNIKYPNSN